MSGLIDRAAPTGIASALRRLREPGRNARLRRMSLSVGRTFPDRRGVLVIAAATSTARPPLKGAATGGRLAAAPYSLQIQLTTRNPIPKAGVLTDLSSCQLYWQRGALNMRLGRLRERG